MPFQVDVAPTPVPNNTYPLLARAKQKGYGHIVLFVSEKQGLIVDAGLSSHYSNRVGALEDFVSHKEDGAWEILPQGTTVTFTQG